MPILNHKIVQTGMAGVNPSLIYLETNDTIQEISVSGYLDDLNRMIGPLSDTYKALVSTKITKGSANTQVYLCNVINQGTPIRPIWSLSAVVISGITNTFGGGGVSFAFNAPGMTTSHNGSVSIRASTNAAFVRSVLPGVGVLNVTFNTDPGAGTILGYVYGRS